MPKVKTPKPEPKYPNLSQNFFRGSVPGQIASVYRDRHNKPEKLQDYKRALADGEVNLGDLLTRSQAEKLTEMGIEVSEGIQIKSPKPKKAAA
jgi:hypothetical protein